ncbi:MAG: NUDIX domain-containing protein [Candidatus Nanohaloarchaea archaeon]
MVKDIPELIRRFEDDFSSEDRVVGVGAMILQGGKFLSVLEKKDYWDRGEITRISYQNVGGQVEEGESVYEALRREASEEIDCGLEIKDSQETVLTDVDGSWRKVGLEEETSPVLVSREKHDGKPGRPDAEGNWYLLGFLFRGEVKGTPEPSREVPALATLSEGLLKKREFTKKQLVEEAGELIEKEPIPADARFYPKFSMKQLLDYRDILPVERFLTD